MKEGEDLARSLFKIHFDSESPAPRAKDYEKNEQMLLAASPLLNSQGKVVGVLYGGLLLNRNYEVFGWVKDIFLRRKNIRGRKLAQLLFSRMTSVFLPKSLMNLETRPATPELLGEW